MGVLSDRQIRKEVSITPFEEGVKRPGKISYGVSSYGYDIRAGYKFKVFTNVWGSVVDPKNFDHKAFVNFDLTPPTSYQPNDHVLIPPNSFALAESMESFKIPRDTLAIVLGKSTYARCGIILNCTPLEPEWEGVITLEISNTTPLPAKIYAAEGIGQVYFLRSDGIPQALYRALSQLLRSNSLTMPVWEKEDLLTSLQEHLSCEVSYADKGGKYQSQVGLTLPQVDGGK